MTNNNELEKRYIIAKRKLFDKAYCNLNEMQRLSVFTTENPLLVLAGAGSGKTTVLVKRIAFIIKYGNAYFSERIPPQLCAEDVKALEEAITLPSKDITPMLAAFSDNPCPPYAVLAITFTNKAANQIKERLNSVLEGVAGIEDIWAGTFHSICVRLLRRYGNRIGYAPGFSIYDADDTKKLLSAIIKDLNIDEKFLPVKAAANEIGRAKDRLVDCDSYAEEAGINVRMKLVARIYTEYQKRLIEANALDFDDIIMQTVKLLRKDGEVLSYCQRRFKYVCVDEYQDTNHAQSVLVNLLAGLYKNIMVVGDDDQSIYKFRGATIENILGFDRTYGEAKVIKLEQNYRSTKTILNAANAVIKNNTDRKGKTLWTESEDGEKIQIRRLYDQNEEARWVTDYILDRVNRYKEAYSDFAILYRTNAQANALETVLAKSGMPYRVLGGMRFYDRKEVKDIVAYLYLINNENDLLRFERIVN